jgi:hypothetical protein
LKIGNVAADGATISAEIVTVAGLGLDIAIAHCS